MVISVNNKVYEDLTFDQAYSHSIWEKAYTIYANQLKVKDEVGQYKHTSVELAKDAALRDAETRIKEAKPDDYFPVDFWKDVRFMISTIENGRYDAVKWKTYMLSESAHYVNVLPRT